MAQKKIPEQIKKNIFEFVEILKKDKLPIERVILFGSYAKGKQQKWSDIDLCIVSPKFNNPFKAMMYLWQKRKDDTGITIEPVGFSRKDFHDTSPLIEEIKKTGIEIPIEN